MRLRLEELQMVAKRAVEDERIAEALRVEVNRVLGPAVIAEGKIEVVAEMANDRIDVLQRTGRASRLAFKPSVVTKFVDHKSPEVRKFAARVIPERFLANMLNDRDHGVRAAVARRLPYRAVSEMLKRFPHDDELRLIARSKKIDEAGIKQPKVDDKEFDIHGDERLGDSAKQDAGAELSNLWYERMAKRFMSDYGGNIEDSWEEVMAHRYVSSVKATSGIDIDEKKLLKAIKKEIEEREERALDRSALKETLLWLRKREQSESLSESAVMPVIEERNDQVDELVSESLSPSTFIGRANSLFCIKESTLPPGIRKHRLGETNARSVNVPVVGRLPHRFGFRPIDERALDMYCKYWNDKQSLYGEPLKLEWSTHPDSVGKISFNVVLR